MSESITQTELASDDRLVQGKQVHTKVHNVVSKHTASMIYGPLWKRTYVNGVVISSARKLVKGRRVKFVKARWNVGDREELKELSLTLIRIGLLETTDTEGPIAIPESALNNIEDNIQGNDDSEPNIQESEVQNSELLNTHGVIWKPQNITQPINGAVSQRPWTVRTAKGTSIAQGSAPIDMRPIEYFYSMFPLTHLASIVLLTDKVLEDSQKQSCTAGEILKFFGVMLLMTRFKFSKRRDLWKRTRANKYIPAPNFGAFLKRDRFELLRSSIRFSYQPERSQNISSEAFRWLLCDDFRKAINQHRQERIEPSELLCVDESIARWYGVGGTWLDVGLPFYVDLDRKPESGCEIQNIACGKGGFMLGMEFAKSESERNTGVSSDTMNHGTQVLLTLASPWTGSNRLVCADSYFASVNAAIEMYRNNLRFTGVVKTATRGFPINYLRRIVLQGRGSHFSLSTSVQVDERVCKLLACAWVDRTRRYFISTAGTTNPGNIQERIRWRHDETHGSHQQLTAVSIPEVAESYYLSAAQIDRHNRVRQCDVDLEKTFKVREWSFRVNTTMLSIIIVDSWLLYKGGMAGRDRMEPHDFFSVLAEELIDNQYDKHGVNHMENSEIVNEQNGSSYMEEVSRVNLMPSRKKRKTNKNASAQRRCKVCSSNLTSWVCTACSTAESENFICHPRSGRACFSTHLKDHH